MLVSTVVVETLDLFDDAEAKKSKEKKAKKYKGGNGWRQQSFMMIILFSLKI